MEKEKLLKKKTDLRKDDLKHITPEDENQEKDMDSPPTNEKKGAVQRKISKEGVETSDATKNPEPFTLIDEELKEEEILKNVIHEEVVNSLSTEKRSDQKHTNEKKDRCYCIRYCGQKDGEDLDIFEIGTLIKLIQGAPEEHIYHSIKWLEDIRRNRARLWRDHLKTVWHVHLQSGTPGLFRKWRLLHKENG